MQEKYNYINENWIKENDIRTVFNKFLEIMGDLLIFESKNEELKKANDRQYDIIQNRDKQVENLKELCSEIIERI